MNFLKAVKDREQGVKEAGVDEDARFEGKRKKESTDERHRGRGGREGLNFNPRVTEFTDICTRVRLAVPRSFSQTTLSLLSVPETYSSSYIRSRIRPFTVLRAEKEKHTHTHTTWYWLPDISLRSNNVSEFCDLECVCASAFAQMFVYFIPTWADVFHHSKIQMISLCCICFQQKCYWLSV